MAYIVPNAGLDHGFQCNAVLVVVLPWLLQNIGAEFLAIRRLARLMVGFSQQQTSLEISRRDGWVGCFGGDDGMG